MVWWIAIVPVPVGYKHVKVKGHVQKQTDYKLGGVYIQIRLSFKKPFDLDLHVLICFSSFFKDKTLVTGLCFLFAHLQQKRILEDRQAQQYVHSLSLSLGDNWITG